MGNLKRVAPIFAVHDLTPSLAHYQQMGFIVRAYDRGGYGFAERNGIEIHLGRGGLSSPEDRRYDPAGVIVDSRSEPSCDQVLDRRSSGQ
jgi:hypothetical protein